MVTIKTGKEIRFLRCNLRVYIFFEVPKMWYVRKHLISYQGVTRFCQHFMDLIFNNIFSAVTSVSAVCGFLKTSIDLRCMKQTPFYFECYILNDSSMVIKKYNMESLLCVIQTNFYWVIGTISMTQKSILDDHSKIQSLIRNSQLCLCSRS